MKFLPSLTLLVWCLSQVRLASGEPNYETLNNAYKEATCSSTDIPNGRYAMIEKWLAPKTYADQLEICIAGYKHIRLIVGDVIIKRPLRSSPAIGRFPAQSYELIKTGILPVGNGIEIEDSGIFDPENPKPLGWNVTWGRETNVYEFLGKVRRRADDRFIRGRYEHYEATWRTYNIATNNCGTFTNWLWNEIKE